jgi:MoxR-like ATPase
MSDTRFYRGQGHSEPKIADALPTVDLEAMRRPEDYRATPELAAAVDVALTLGMPLLLTGEPGSGKSGLADSLAWELGLGEPLRFPVKSDTESRDLFYRFDTVGRFHAAQARPADGGDEDRADAGRFIAFEALGQAILHAKPPAIERELRLPPGSLAHPGAPRRSVVLIDEIDKAPRDVPNDILVETERMAFGIPELSGSGRALVHVALTPEEARWRPIVIFTSNSEKALPDPFLRRCVYHHLGFPPFDADLPKDAQGNLPEDRVTVDTIVAARLGSRFQRKQQAEANVADALDLFRTLRGEGLGLTRRPTLAELLDWLDHLMPQRLPPSAWTQLAALRAGGDADTEQRLLTAITSLLLKRPADKARAPTLLAQWRQTRNARQ